jgi:bacterioferritin-associated ferredoxin
VSGERQAAEFRRSRTVLCLCHDVTEADIADAVAEGFTDPETIKRYTAAFMGPCQGKWCARLVLDAIARHTGVPADKLRQPTTRPPVVPVRLGALAGGRRELS